MSGYSTLSDPPPPPSPPFEWVSLECGWTLVCGALAPLHGWTTRGLELARPEQTDDDGWRRLARTAGVSPDLIVHLRQVHGADVLEVSCDRRVDGQPADAVITRDPGVVASVRVADCVPVLLADPETGAVGAVHAGWRGTTAGVTRRAVQSMSASFGSRPSALVAAIGPSIGPCCYETGGEVRRVFGAAGWPEDALARWFGDGSRLHLDLWMANRDQLVAAGLDPARVFVSSLCTACHLPWFPSFRREGTGTGRMVGFIKAPGAPW